MHIGFSQQFKLLGLNETKCQRGRKYSKGGNPCVSITVGGERRMATMEFITKQTTDASNFGVQPLLGRRNFGRQSLLTHEWIPSLCIQLVYFLPFSALEVGCEEGERAVRPHRSARRFGNAVFGSFFFLCLSRLVPARFSRPVKMTSRVLACLCPTIYATHYDS